MSWYDKRFMAEKFGYRKALNAGSNNIQHKEFIGKIIKEYGIKTIFDSGCGKGNNFTYYFMQQIYPDGMIYSVDKDYQMSQICKFIYSKEGVLNKYKNNIKVYHDTSLNILKELKDEHIEMFFLDADTELEEMRFITKNWSDNIHICTHDYNAGKGFRLRPEFGKLVKNIINYKGIEMAYFYFEGQ